MIRFDVITLFPSMFGDFLSTSIIQRAQTKGKLQVVLTDPRSFACDGYGTVDDAPYGGGGGMILKPEPIFAAVEHVLRGRDLPVLLFSPQGRVLTQSLVKEIALHPWSVLLCGHYEGFDERIRSLVTLEVSIGDYVLTGGELPAMVLIDAVSRCVPSVLGGEDVVGRDSFGESGLLEYPHYTRPFCFRSLEVPSVLRSGNHRLIEQWRRRQSLLRTLQRRPELLRSARLTAEDYVFLRTKVGRCSVRKSVEWVEKGEDMKDAGVDS
ncbi:tRNA (guanosine(37)-N1)-methyltransferase TrmD [Pasteuria penetrans]|uniref:tRNA (guanosine(37)-N1)-methyltransferase TrmD n=1 Tax=Pasteuria penetrans TaxID=86005 RepID=UPI000FAA8592